MKRLIFFLIGLSSLFAACNKDNAARRITLNKTSCFLAVNDTTLLVATVHPAGVIDRKVVWKSSDESVAVVEKGLVTAFSEGTATLTASVANGTIVAECDVTVNWLGKATFKTDRTWTVGSQVWSDAVVATGCQKKDFDTGDYRGPGDYEYRADCRQNPGYGDLFSWNTVDEYRTQLCPAGWRVPTIEDFCLLDKTLNGREDCTTREDIASRDKYLSADWGGEYGGLAHSDSGSVAIGGLHHQGVSGYYWSQSGNPAYGYYMGFSSSVDWVFPQADITKNTGFALRCIKGDAECADC